MNEKNSLGEYFCGPGWSKRTPLRITSTKRGCFISIRVVNPKTLNEFVNRAVLLQFLLDSI
jgi:hypothetical protein